MKKSSLLFLLAALSFSAHAETMFQFLDHALTHQPSPYSSSSNPEAPGEDRSIFGEANALRTTSFCTTQVFKGEIPVLVNSGLSAKTKLGCYDEFTVLHSGVTRTPLWSAEYLTRDRIIAAAHLPRENRFHEEEKLPVDERADLSDYARSGYDRGHNAPNKDFDSPMAQWQCFSLANMMPQNPNNNRGLWEGIESAVRTLTEESGELYVVTGPLFIGNSLQSLHGRVTVPTQIYKAVLDPRSGHAAAYLVNNVSGMDYKVISIAELERISGIEVFPGISQHDKEDAMNLPKPTPYRHPRN